MRFRYQYINPLNKESEMTKLPSVEDEGASSGGANGGSKTPKKKVTPFMLFIITLSVIAVCITLFTLLNK